MFREVMRDKERELDKNSALEIIKKGSYGVLSTIDENGYPYGVPLNYTYIDDCICFHCGHEGHKIDNIKNCENVSFCVVTKSNVLANEFDTDYESAIAFGKASKVADDAKKEEILLSVINKYSPEFMKAGKNYMKKFWDDTTVVKIEIEHFTGKARK
ncbi:MAG: pyridoxamine 5'-phosphate oxidase family protein [Desulfobacterales bacterium]|nr:pyridoxamine 5'-phosphate oxidase family protein [Desulfobacterales bacterium]